MAKVTYEKEITALLVIDPYNDFISQGGKIWDHIRAVAEANDCVPHMLQVLNSARNAGLRVFYAMHHRYRPGDYETWKYIAPIQKAAWKSKIFEYGTWGGEIRPEFELEVVGAAVLVVKVVGVLPDVVPKQNAFTVHQRAVLVGPRFDCKLAVGRNGDEHPAGTEHPATRLVEVAR